MPGIKELSVVEFQLRIGQFAQRYVEDWEQWIQTPQLQRPKVMGAILRKWQAFRPNTSRRTRAENTHESPYIEDLIDIATQHIGALENFRLSELETISEEVSGALDGIWQIFEELSFGHRARNGLAGVVGISKATLLLTNGQVGPAFDSKVRGQLRTGDIADSNSWCAALKMASQDIREFEERVGTTMLLATPVRFQHLSEGRIYDMALGPRGAAA